jgi:hypothetical protein
VAAAPEFAVGPALFLAIVFEAGLQVAFEFFFYKSSISAQGGMISAK